MVTYTAKLKMYINIDEHIFDAFHKCHKYTVLPQDSRFILMSV